MWELGGVVGVWWHGLVELLTVFVSVRVLCFSGFCWWGNEEGEMGLALLYISWLLNLKRHQLNFKLHQLTLF